MRNLDYYINSFNSVGDIVNRDILFIESSRTIEDVLESMTSNTKTEAIILKDINVEPYVKNVQGLIKMIDVMRLIVHNVNINEKIGDKLNSKINTINIEQTIHTAKTLLKERSIERLLVIENEKIVGIVTLAELFKYQDIDGDEIEIQLRIILGNLHEAVCVINTSGIVTFWNSSSEKLYGIPKDDIVGGHIERYFPNALLMKVLKEDKAFENIKHKPKVGSDIIISAIPLRYKGKLIGAVSTDRDVDEVTNLYMELDKEKKRVEHLRQQMAEITHDKYYFGKIIGKSKGLTDAIRLAKQVAKTDASVLITGESGTGKEVFSRAIHKESERTGNFIPVNCSAIPANLLESELFGYVEGAFTGAYKKGRAGKFELADKGTLFLDEIGDMPLLMQAKLLRVLQDGIVNRVGSEESIKVNARIIAATNKDLNILMKQGEFREDLYYRLNVVSLVIPPLRERKEDIADLINSFILEFSDKNNIGEFHISPDAMKILTDYSWSGNVRQVRNTIERLVILSKNNRIDIGDIPSEIIQTTNVSPFMDLNINGNFDLKKSVEEFERNVIIKALETSKGNKVQAAELLNIKRTTLYYKINLYDINSYLEDEEI